MEYYTLGGGDKHLTAVEVVDAAKEARVDSLRLRLIRRWLGQKPEVGQECPTGTPYGKIRRVS